MKKHFVSAMLLCVGVVLGANADDVETVKSVNVVDLNGNVTASYDRSKVGKITFTTEEKADNDFAHEMVDLGLPSKLLWSACNVGAATGGDYGKFFAWGERSSKAWNASGVKPAFPGYCDSNTKYYDSTQRGYTKYNTTDNLITLQPSDDAATANWGTDYRMPTKAEFEELMDANNCTWTWTSQKDNAGNSTNGYLVTSKTNSNSIFLPAADYCGGISCYRGDGGGYWSSTLNSSTKAYYLRFLSTGSYYINSDSRCVGHVVRPVSDK